MDHVIPSLRTILADIPEFRQAQGRRYPLLPLLVLTCVAMLAGYRSPTAIAEWAHNYGLAWLRRCGFPRPQAPSRSTLERVFAGLDVTAVEAALARWAEAVLHAYALEPLPAPAL